MSLCEAKKGKIKFDSSSSAMEVMRGRDLSTKTAIVTGANSGIGKTIIYSQSSVSLVCSFFYSIVCRGICSKQSRGNF